MLAARWPERQVLARAVTAAKAAGAHGVVWFRLPEPTNSTGWSLRQLGALGTGETGEPALVLRRDENARLVLKNESNIDLAPRLSGTASPLDRGYALELDAPGPIFREALAGDFWKVAGHIDPEATARAVAVPLATRVTFWFSHLRAGESLRSGLIALAPEADFEQIRYRILNAPGAEQWRQLQ